MQLTEYLYALAYIANISSAAFISDVSLGQISQQPPQVPPIAMLIALRKQSSLNCLDSTRYLFISR